MLDGRRRFRHIFRTLYRFDLDPARVAQVRAMAFRLEPLIEEDFTRFLEFVNALIASEE